MQTYEAIFIRKSIRKYDEKGLPQEEMKRVEEIIQRAKRLYTDIDMQVHVVKEGVKIQEISSGLIGSYGKIKAPHYFVITSEEKDGYLENIGFTLENAVLELAAMGVGTCWIGGMVKKELLKGIINMPAGHKPVIVISFGHPTEGTDLARGALNGAKRKPLEEIVKGEMDGDWRNIMEAVRLAPSAMNGQPWRFTIAENQVHVFIVKKAALLAKHLGLMNRIDVGIAMSHLYTGARYYNKNIRFERLQGMEVKGLVYITSGKME